jgi:hypothetical protein
MRRRLTVKITFVYKGFLNGLLTENATHVDKYWNEDTQKIEVFSKLVLESSLGLSL